MRPWVEDHVLMDDSLRRRWAGEDVDLTGRPPSDLVLVAEQDDESSTSSFPWTARRLPRPTR